MRTLLCAALSLAPAVAQAADFDALYRRAEQLRLGGRAEPPEVQAAYRRALAAFDLRAKGTPGYDQGLLAAGFAAYQATDYTRAAELLDESMRRSGPSAFAVEYRLWSLLLDQQYTLCLREARARDKAFGAVIARFLRGRGSGQLALAPEAGRLTRVGDDLGLWAFRRIATAADDHPLALSNLALTLRHVGLEEECERVYRRALEKTPEDLLLWNDLGLFFKGLGRHDEAAEALRRSYDLEASKGTGPATTNLLLLSRNTGRAHVEEPREALAAVLRDRADSALGRRVCIDRILGR